MLNLYVISIIIYNFKNKKLSIKNILVEFQIVDI
jgi:hypothetical protein